MNDLAFSTLNLHSSLLDNLSTLDYNNMTPIQSQSLPHILQGLDVIGQGKTGSGKTAAFGLGILQTLNVASLQIQALVLCPTRELADQVSKEIRRLGRTIANIKILTLAGGMPLKAQTASLAHGAHIIVGTPGRIDDHLQRGSIHLQYVKTLVLDEADRMLEMGFQSQVDAIVAQLPKQRQSLLFSATFPEQIQRISQRIMNKPIMVQVESSHDHALIQQHFYQVTDHESRIQALRLLLLQHQPESALIFCNTKRDSEEVANALIYQGFTALALNGDLEQWERDQAMVRFANQSISILVATDVAARGLDIDALDLVINYHIAQDPETHVHRTGRTGRAGKQGMACSLFSEKEHFKITRLGDYLEKSIIGETLPDSTHLNHQPNKARMTTLQIGGGKKQKLRPGDILGALTGKGGVAGSQVGKIHILDHWAYVAVERGALQVALRTLKSGTLKGKKFRIRCI